MPATPGRCSRRAIQIFGIAAIAGCTRPTPDVAPRATPASDAAVARVRGIADEVVALAQEIGGVPRANRSQFNPASLARWDASVDRWLAELRPIKLDELAPRPEWVILGVMREGLEASVGLRTCSDRPALRDDCYAAIVRSSTTLQLGASDLPARGTEEQAKIDPELTDVAGKLFGVSSARAKRNADSGRPALRGGSREKPCGLPSRRRSIASAAPSWFVDPPADTLVIRPETPGGGRRVARRTIQPRVVERRVAGLIINTYKPEEQNRANVLNAVVHEGYPGHTFNSIERRAPGQHFVLRLFSPTSFIEGWAFYAERLADEMGVYSTEMERAAYLVHLTDGALALRVDAALNTGRWTKEQAIDTMMTIAGRQRWQAEVYANRHLNTPGQTVSYMVGYRAIMDLRDLARRKLGAKFDIRAFHAQILNDGPVTMPMLAAKVERWIEATTIATQAREN
jgi:uncharacterized protein (DUF885 family)